MNLLKIENKIGKVKLNDAVTPWSADDLILEIEKQYGNKAVAENMVVAGFTASASDALDTLEIEINSPGGSVLDGYRVYNSLMQMRSRGVQVIATVNTLAASMGSVILMAANKVRIVEGGRIMIHEASQAIHGTSEDHLRAAKNLEEISIEISAIYSKKTGAKPEEMRELMKSETWMGAKESVERKFADEILSFDGENNSVDIGGENTSVESMSLLTRLTQPSNVEALEQITALENQISGHDLEISDLTAKLETAEAALEEAALLVTANADLTIQAATIPDFESKIVEFTSKIAELEESNVITAEKIDAAAATKLAAMGHGPQIDLGQTSALQVAAKEVTREGFNAMSPQEKSNFSKAGGVIN